MTEYTLPDGDVWTIESPGSLVLKYRPEELEDQAHLTEVLRDRTDIAVACCSAIPAESEIEARRVFEHGRADFMVTLIGESAVYAFLKAIKHLRIHHGCAMISHTLSPVATFTGEDSWDGKRATIKAICTTFPGIDRAEIEGEFI